MQVQPNNPEFQTWLKGALHNGSRPVCVTFTKKDGTEREMQCTLSESLIPSAKQPAAKTEATSPTSGSAIRVFDTTIQEWRSFRWDSIKSVTLSL
jgi:hypothetical protein